MNHSPESGTGYPLLICGLPRAGTSFLFAVLSTHPAFANEQYKDKELRYFEKLLGNRPWGGVDAVSQKRFADIDGHIMPDILRTLDGRLRQLRGGPLGHYLNANPRDIFYSQIILEAVPDTRFLVCLRDPLTNIWSALNYPSHAWGQRDETGFFREADVRQTAEHWNKVISHTLRYGLHERPETFFILEQERLASGPPELHAEMERFLGLPGIAELLDRHANRVVHSSFIEANEATGTRGHDRIFASREEKRAHFNNVQRLFAEDGRYAGLVLDICGPFVTKLNDIGLLLDSPATRLLPNHTPAQTPAQATPGPGGTSPQDIAVHLLASVTGGMPGLIVRVGACDGPALAALRTDRCAVDGWREHLIEADHFLSVAALPAQADILLLDAGAAGLDRLMGLDLMGPRLRLFALSMTGITPQVKTRAINVLSNLGYLCVGLGESLLAVRRDCLDTGQLAQLAQRTSSS